MTDKNSEMTLDEVLSSIRKMVINQEPPVLDLINMVKSDGSIVKIEVNDAENPDMSSFLKLIQENTEPYQEKEHGEKKEAIQHSQESLSTSASLSTAAFVPKKLYDEKQIIAKSMEESSIPLINKWIDDNLPSIAKQIVEEKIRELLKKYATE
ncbi:MAG: DUF2497 domain-containing protein [Holosporaceae bacterium]|jgi:cell pole-organizing protein PopZ|nr:DUF2497 domain-containing protein [Holosporaceae bacterium]